MKTIIGLAVTLLLGACGAQPPAGDVAHGARLAAITGCISCHGATLDGHLFEEDAGFAIAWSSNLSRILPTWSDAQIEATLRTGKRPDGSALWFMPTFAHRALSPADMRDLIAWLRTVPPSGALQPPLVRGPGFAPALKAGFSDAAAQAVRLASRVPASAGAAHERGRYLARIACAECHGPELAGPKNPRPGDPPDLSVAAAYTPAAFARLLRTGVGADGRPAGEMASEARKRLAALSDEEIAAIHGYLRARTGASRTQ